MPEQRVEYVGLGPNDTYTIHEAAVITTPEGKPYSVFGKLGKVIRIVRNKESK